MTGSLTHLDERGRARMVDVSDKDITRREATARAIVSMQPETARLIASGGVAKGDVLAVAQVAGVMAAKRTPDLIPLCHPLPISGVDMTFDLDVDRARLEIHATVRVTSRTGVEMAAPSCCRRPGARAGSSCGPDEYPSSNPDRERQVVAWRTRRRRWTSHSRR